MKRLLLSLFFLFSLSGISQTTVFNEGWDTQPKKLISATANTAIVFETNTKGTGRYGKLLKYKVVGDEYIKLGEMRLSETLIDYRFNASQKLQLIGLHADHCDYSDSSDFWIYTIDTSSFTVDKSQPMKQRGFTKMAFAHGDNVIASDNNNTWILSLISNQTLHQGFMPARFKDLIIVLFNGNFVLSYSGFLGLTLENVNGNWAGFHSGFVPQRPTNTFSYGTDSILMVTDSAIYKTDTNLLSFHRINLPYHQFNKIIGNEVFLINSNVSYTYSLPAVTLASSDTLAGLPTKFKLVDVFPNNQKMAALALAQKSSALNEMVVKADIHSQSESERSEVRIDSIFPLDTVVVNTSGWVSYEVLLRVYCHNDGNDTIRSLECLYSEYNNDSICGPLLNSFKQLTIAPGGIGSFDQKIKIDGGKYNVCIYVSTPNSNLEDNLNDNRSCMGFTISLDELSENPLVNIYPNPTSGLLYVEGTFTLKSGISLFGMDGREYKAVVSNISDEKLNVELSHVAPGVYFLKMQTGDQTLIKKVIKN